ncbi:hypothetical protein [uncultured Roseobacter sp.]|uniref:hypothetical protein n=1 Tax=uncultured Roseobacter sp. TaxID=114847 RepID=UPI002620C7EA|nr:hypothetical protein [uncultured Roseobacter sp.]
MTIEASFVEKATLVMDDFVATAADGFDTARWMALASCNNDNRGGNAGSGSTER